MKLSVIIVNYNVKYFLEQCLHSVIRASKNIHTEVIVVDNNSVDGSCAMVKKKFPYVLLIENKTNTGFSYANNQAIKRARGEYVLLLNPDTLIEENTFTKSILFMDTHEEAGCLGVRMIDGNGKFLPESKRAFPTPSVAFYKIFGLTWLFPKSKIFGKYYLGYLDNNSIHEIEIVAGAFMFIRKTALEKSGLLDESFFMYGEDIDLSYRLMKAGYKNYYFPETTIIHYKGESTKKGSLNYVHLFYKAMVIFSRKHFSTKITRTLSLLIHLAICFRSFLSIGSRICSNFILPIADTVLLYSGFLTISTQWELFKFGKTGNYPPEYFYYEIPVYILIWIVSIFFSRGYEKPFQITKSTKGIIYGSLIILVVYSLLPEHLRFSRALILFGSLWGILSTIGTRAFLHIPGIKIFRLSGKKNVKTIIVGSREEFNKLKNTLSKNNTYITVAGLVTPGEETSPHSIGTLNQVNEIIAVHKIDQIVFSTKNISAQQIIKSILKISETKKIEYKLADYDGVTLISSKSINNTNDFYPLAINSIGTNYNKLRKRLFDFLVSLCLLVLSPILIFFFQNPGKLLKNILPVFTGKYSFIGYASHSNYLQNTLPKIKKGILSPLPDNYKQDFTPDEIEKVNIQYAKNYLIRKDFHILLSKFKYLDK